MDFRGCKKCTEKFGISPAAQSRNRSGGRLGASLGRAYRVRAIRGSRFRRVGIALLLRYD